MAIGVFITGKVIMSIAAFSLATFLIFLRWWTKKKDEVRENLPFRVKRLEDLEDGTYEFIKSFQRKKEAKERPYFGAIMFMLAVGLTFLLFPQTAAVLAVMVVSISDSTSTAIGVHFGNTELPYNPSKSLEGSSAFFLTAMGIALFFATPLNSILIALSGTIVESLPRIDDNFSVPITVGVLFALL